MLGVGVGTDGVADGVGVGDADGVELGSGVGAGLGVGVTDGVGVGTDGVADGVGADGVGAGVGAGVGLVDGVGLGVGVTDGLGSGVGVGVGVGVGLVSKPAFPPASRRIIRALTSQDKSWDVILATSVHGPGSVALMLMFISKRAFSPVLSWTLMTTLSLVQLTTSGSAYLVY